MTSNRTPKIDFIPVKSNSFKKHIFPLIFLSLIWLMVQIPTEAMSKNLVTGQYGSSSGKRIVLNLHIQNPAPANLIVEQYLSPQNSIVSTSPRAKKDSAGKIKWLFRNTATGKLSISIQLKSPLKGKIRGVVRYRDPGSGAFIESQISP